MRILGIDPGIGRAGWGIIDVDHGKTTVVDYGCIETPKDMLLEKRLQLLYDELQLIIQRDKPHSMGVEELFFNTNVKTALVVGQARGIVLLVAAQHKLSVSSYTPSQVKVAVAGFGGAKKNQVGQMVKTLLKLPHIPTPDDTADALAIALTHAFTARYHVTRD